MLVAFNVMQHKHCSISRWQLLESIIQGNAIHNGHCIRVLRASDNLYWCVAFFGCPFEFHTSFSEMHQTLIYSQSMKPGREC